MKLSLRWRAAGAWWILPIAIALPVLLLQANPPGDDPSAISVSVAAAWTQVVIAPVVAGAAAWSAAMLRRSRWFAKPRTRGMAILIADAVWPAIICGICGEGAALIIAMSGYGWLGVPAPAPVAIALMTTIAAAISGFAAGKYLSLVLAAPISVLGWYLLLAFPPAMDPLWLRHLTGVSDCCSVSRSLNPHVVYACLATFAALAIASYSIVLFRSPSGDHRPKALVIGCGFSVALVAFSVTSVYGLDFDPSVPRSTPVACANTAMKGRLEICVFPEERGRLAALTATAEKSFGPILRSMKTDAPHVLTESENVDQRSGERSVRLPPGIDERQVAANLGGAAFPDLTPSCRARSNVAAKGGDSTGFTNLDAAQSFGSQWFQSLAVATLTSSTISRSATDLNGGELPDGFASLLRMSNTNRQAWLDAASDAVITCDPARLPSSGPLESIPQGKAGEP